MATAGTVAKPVTRRHTSSASLPILRQSCELPIHDDSTAAASTATRPIRQQKFWNACFEKAHSDGEFYKLLKRSQEAIVCFVDAAVDMNQLSVALEALAVKHTGATFIFVDGTRLRGVTQQYNVTTFPTLIAFMDGQESQNFEFVDEAMLNDLLLQRRSRTATRFGNSKKYLTSEYRESQLRRRQLRASKAVGGDKLWHVIEMKPHTDFELSNCLSSSRKRS
jgi:hypothetical protein